MLFVFLEILPIFRKIIFQVVFWKITEFFWQVFGFNDHSVTQYGNAFNGIFQFPDVSGPMILLKDFYRFRSEIFRFDLASGTNPL